MSNVVRGVKKLSYLISLYSEGIYVGIVPIKVKNLQSFHVILYLNTFTEVKNSIKDPLNLHHSNYHS